MNKRISTRGIIIEDDSVIAMFRRKIKDDGTIKEYYVVPGGGIEEGESLEEGVIRELKEELSVDVKVLGYLGKEESDDAIAHYFNCEIIAGEPKLGGPELERHCESNYYEIRRVNKEELDNVDISAKDMIIKAFNNQYEEM